MTTKSKNQSKDHIPRDLKPSNPDTQYFGGEPIFVAQPDPDRRNSAMSKGFNWYSKFYDRKSAKEMLAEYCEYNGLEKQAKLLRKVSDAEVMPTLCWLARMNRRGLTLTDSEQERLNVEIARLLETLAKVEVVGGQEPLVEQRRPNIQEIMREKAQEAAGELEGLLDDYMIGGAKSSVDYKFIDEVARFNVMPQHINLIADVWRKKIEEFEAAHAGTDKDLAEGYRHLTKTQLKNIIKFCETVINDLNGYANIKKANKTPRMRKPVPVERIVKNLKYLREFKDDTAKLNLVSVHPTKLHNASEAWVYDTAKRKLHHYVADEYSKTFTVKGNTLVGFDKVKSEVKTLRKPAEQIKEIMGSKPAARKFFTEIKATPTIPNGRFNENMIILKAW